MGEEKGQIAVGNDPIVLSPSDEAAKDIRSGEVEMPRKIGLELRRKQIEEERLRKQKEMDELLAEEQAIMAQGFEICSRTDGNPMQEERSVESPELAVIQSAMGENDDPECTADPITDEAVDDLYGHMKNEERSTEDIKFANDDDHEMLTELENLEDSDDDVREKRKKAISPVTWDVDVHATVDDQLSEDSPLPPDEHSDDDGGQRSTSTRSEASLNVGEKTEGLVEGSSSVSDQVAIPEAEEFRPRLHKYLYREAKYFMVKSNNHENVRLARAKGVWSTPPQNQIKFNNAINQNTTVILVFSVKESGNFQGFARIDGPSSDDGPRVAWVLPPGISARALSGVFKLDWISRTDLAFEKTMHLRNPWNEFKPVKIARDGQEIEPRVGEELCKLFAIDGSSDYERVISRVKRKREALTSKGIVPRTHRPVQSASRGRGRSYRPVPFRGPPAGGYRDPEFRPRDARERIDTPYGRAPPTQNHPQEYLAPYPPSGRYPYGGNYDSRIVYERAPYQSAPNPQAAHSTISSYQQPASSYSTGVSTDIIAKGSYDDYLNELRRSSGYLPHDTSTPSGGYDDYHSSSRNPPPAPIPTRESHSSSRRSYDRQVEDFLRRTTSSASRSRPDRERRRDDRRERSRSRDRIRYRDYR